MKSLAMISLALLALGTTPGWALPLIEFSPDPSTAGNWSYDGNTGVLAFEQDVVVDRGIGSNSDELVNAHVYIPAMQVSGSEGVYDLAIVGSDEIKITSEDKATTYMTGTLRNSGLITIGTIGAGYSQFSTDITNVMVTSEGEALGSAALDILMMSALPGEATLDFVLREMTHPEGGFYSSLDADSEGEEGIFYVWTPEQIQAAVSNPDEAKLLMAAYGVNQSGNFRSRGRRYAAWSGCI